MMNPTRLPLCAALGLLCLTLPASARVKHTVPKKAAKAAPARPSPHGAPAALAPISDWTSTDIGKVGRPGSSRIGFGPQSNTVIVDASGEDIFGKADSFRSVYRLLTGDIQVVARVVSYQRRDQWTKVGVMVRESDAPGARFADIVLTPDHGAEFQWRTLADGDTQTTDQTPAPAPYWVKLTRTGDVFVGSISPDGRTWTERGRATIPMAAKVLVGACVTSHKNDETTEAVLDGLRVSPISANGR